MERRLARARLDRAKPHCIARLAKKGIVRLSLRPSGSYTSVSVAASAPKKTGYSRRLTDANIVEPITKQTANIATAPSIDFRPPRPIRTVDTSRPKLTPMMAALMSPSTRKRIDVIAIDGGEIARARRGWLVW